MRSQQMIEDVREQGYRQVADALEYIVQRVNDGTKPEDIDHHELPLDERDSVILITGIGFGALFQLDELEELNAQPPGHSIIRDAIVRQEQVLDPVTFEVADVREETTMDDLKLPYRCTCGEEFDTQEQAKEHVSDL